MEYSIIKGATEKALKSEPEFLGEKHLIILDKKKENLSEISENVEFYLEVIDEETYVLYIYGTEYIYGMCYAIREALRGTTIEDAFVRRKPNEECVIITIDI